MLEILQMILVLDIGKTNKKHFVFDEGYRIVQEGMAVLEETIDEDGDSCEDLEVLKIWVRQTLQDVLQEPRFQIRAINVTTYGASLVHLNADYEPVTPLYNYLKPFPVDLKKQFFETYGAEAKIALETASPVLGNLNSGMQLYWLKHRKPGVFREIKYTLHLPQYISFLVSEALKSRGDSVSPRDFSIAETTSIGCHTMLWDFTQNDYHDWVKAEGIAAKFPPIRPSNSAVVVGDTGIYLGSGLHDSSAALIPYLANFSEPFVLISTGTWCISLNPFNEEPLTAEELAQDCLCYLSYEGKPVKAARYFGGHEHALKVQELALTFGLPEDFYQHLSERLASPAGRAYEHFMHQLMEKQVASTRLAIGNSSVKHLFVDGGFSKNHLYMHLLAQAFPDLEVFAADIAQATALGGAMAIHPYWNPQKMPDNPVPLKKHI